jgi:DNA-binding transcriptional MerR regulator
MNNNEEFMKKAVAGIEKNRAIAPDEVPDIPLYMDQVLTLMDRYFPQEDKEHAFTKTMINNYVKSGLLPPPDRKKYSQEHIYKLFIIYYMKSILKIDEIDTVLSPAGIGGQGKREQKEILKFYEQLHRLAGKHYENFTAALKEACLQTDGVFADEPDERRKDLQFSLFISLLSLDAWLSKTAAETMIREYRAQKAAAEKKSTGRAARPRSKS